MLYKDVLNKYEAHLQARKQSKVYYNYIKLFLQYCQKQNIDYINISQEIITNFFNSTEYAINSRNNFIKAGRSFYLFLGQIDSEWLKIALMKPEKRLPSYLTEADLKKAIKCLAT